MAKLFEEFSSVTIRTKYLEMDVLLHVLLKMITYVKVNLPFVKVQFHHQRRTVEMGRKMHRKHVTMETLKTATDVQVVVQSRMDILVTKAVHQCVQKQQET